MEMLSEQFGAKQQVTLGHIVLSKPCFQPFLSKVGLKKGLSDQLFIHHLCYVIPEMAQALFELKVSFLGYIGLGIKLRETSFLQALIKVTLKRVYCVNSALGRPEQWPTLDSVLNAG